MAMARSLSVFSLRFSLLLPRCLHSTAAPPLPTLILARRHNPAAAALCRSLPPVAARFTAVRCNANRAAENMAYSPLNNSRRPGGEGATKQQMIDCYIQTLAKVLGSEEEAKKKIYNVSCERYFGFGCEIDEETSNKLEGLPGVLFVLPDSYVDPENKDYGAELFVNGEIVQRSPERQRRVELQPQRHQDRPRYNDRTRYARRR
ncbi:Multiple organellar RNA editing factor 2 [Arachis hypogaea]|nr:Multiple organellar RNA editing factor 2 [Arachis hypogaea]